MNEDNNKKDIEVVQGMGNLDISPVYDNATSAKPKMQDEKPKNIIIPQVKKAIEKEKDAEEDEATEESEDLEEFFDDLVDTVEEGSEISEDDIDEDDIDEDDETDF